MACEFSKYVFHGWELILKDVYYRIEEKLHFTFHAIKAESHKIIILPYSEETTPQTDASRKRFEAVILQDANHIYYASRMLTSAERI